MIHHDFASDLRAGIAAAGGAVSANGGDAVRLLRWADLGPCDHARWTQLSDRAGTANVFAQHWFMDAALRHCAAPDDVRIAIAADAAGRWIGLLPLVRAPRFGRWPVANWRTWTATNQFLGAPLVLPHAAFRFWRLLLGHFDAHADGALLIHCHQFAADNPVAAALVGLCADDRRPLHLVNRFDRPARRPGSEAAPDAKTASRARSLARRLERDHGPVRYEMLGKGDDAQPWIDAFLALEGAGWKGRAGSAIGCAPDTEALFREVVREGQRRGQLRIARVTTAGGVAAMSSWFVSGKRGFGFKMTYDEALRSYAPGLLLMRYVAEQVGAEPDMFFDTCASPGAHSGGAFWRDRRTMFDCAIAIGTPRRRRLFSGLMRAREVVRRRSGERPV
jgi:CelD/BcsL family acetyltransferase involved in cellulose biosynthesis